MKRGETEVFSHLDYLCHGIEGRCWLCGGRWSECQCGDYNFDACICGAHSETWRDMHLRNLCKLIKNLVYNLYVGLRWKDWWWFTKGCRGK